MRISGLLKSGNISTTESKIYQLGIGNQGQVNDSYTYNSTALNDTSRKTQTIYQKGNLSSVIEQQKPEKKTNSTMQEAPVIIIGVGTSGIATAACLTKQSIPIIMLEREDCFASLWQKYTYDRLHLHLRKQVCELPYLPFPASYPHYVPRKQFIEYLDNYMKHFKISPLYHRAVELAEYDDEKWRVKAKNRSSGQVEEYSSRFLVLATGETAEPRVPEIEGLESFKGKVLHSTGYKNGKEYKDEHVLVVGSGNSGMEIALDLANFGAKPSIIVRSPVLIVNYTGTVFLLF